MEGPLPTALILEYKKTAPYPPWDKSCTPAIPPKLTFQTSARFTRHHACPMDNGWVPVGIYLVSRKPPSKVHSLGRAPPRSHHPGLSSGLPHRLLLFLTGFMLFGCWGYYSRPSPVCQASIFPDADLFSPAQAPGRKPAARKKCLRRRAKVQFNSKKGKLPYTSNIRSP